MLIHSQISLVAELASLLRLSKWRGFKSQKIKVRMVTRRVLKPAPDSLGRPGQSRVSPQMGFWDYPARYQVRVTGLAGPGFKTFDSSLN